LSPDQQCDVSDEKDAGKAGEHEGQSRLGNDRDEPGAHEDRDQDEQDIAPSLSGFAAEEGVICGWAGLAVKVQLRVVQLRNTRLQT
jgi:hypothetical protein